MFVHDSEDRNFHESDFPFAFNTRVRRKAYIEECQRAKREHGKHDGDGGEQSSSASSASATCGGKEEPYQHKMEERVGDGGRERVWLQEED